MARRFCTGTPTVANPSPFDPILKRLTELLGESGVQRLLPDFDALLAQFELVPRSTFEAHLRTLQELQLRVAELENQVSELEQG